MPEWYRKTGPVTIETRVTDTPEPPPGKGWKPHVKVKVRGPVDDKENTP